MSSRHFASLVPALMLAGCGQDSSPKSNEDRAVKDVQIEAVAPIAPEDASECDKAKKAAVAARTIYDRDYERRNPGMQSMSLSEDELTTCRLGDAGAFLGKWGGQRWRFVPKVGSSYATDPKSVWVGQDEGLDDLSWFSEWRSEGASTQKNEELNRELKAARNIYG